MCLRLALCLFFVIVNAFFKLKYLLCLCADFVVHILIRYLQLMRFYNYNLFYCDVIMDRCVTTNRYSLKAC